MFEKTYTTLKQGHIVAVQGRMLVHVPKLDSDKAALFIVAAEHCILGSSVNHGTCQAQVDENGDLIKNNKTEEFHFLQKKQQVPRTCNEAIDKRAGRLCDFHLFQQIQNRASERMELNSGTQTAVPKFGASKYHAANYLYKGKKVFLNPASDKAEEVVDLDKLYEQQQQDKKRLKVKNKKLKRCEIKNMYVYLCIASNHRE